MYNRSKYILKLIFEDRNLMHVLDIFCRFASMKNARVLRYIL